MERPKSRGVFSFLRKKKKKSSPSFSSDFPFPLPHTAAVEKRDIDIALAGNHHARYDSSETFATSSQSSLTHGIQNLNIGVSDTGTGTQSEGYRGILTQPSYIRASRKEHGQRQI
jgi:hypothetical protein